MKILVTGATGFVARHLVPALAERHQVVALGHDPGRIATGDGVEPLALDLREPGLETHLPEVDAIVHLAQANVPFPEGAADLFAVNTASTVALLEHARRVGARRFVLASSASVYGFGDRPWSENDPTGASDFYSATKLAAERFVAAYRGYVDTTIMRLVAPYGPGQRNRMIPRLIASVREGRPIVLNASDRPRTNPIYVDDVTKVVEAALASDGHHLLNVAGDDVASIRELGEAIGRALGVEPTFEQTDTATADIVVDNRRMHDSFDLGNLVPLESGIPRTASALE
jgi:nucleoside-diphosphate-sugar epimerase